MLKKILLGVAGVVVVLVALGAFFAVTMLKQTNNEDPKFWEKDIQKIEQRYDGPEDVDIVFVGSSSIRKWETLSEDFAEYKVVNHGFGGSKVADTTYYFNRLVTAFSPEAVVVFAGTNDIHGVNDASKTGDEVFELVKELYEKSQQELPSVPVYYISISPTNARWKAWDEANLANQRIMAYASSQRFLVFIDTTEELLKQGIPNEDLYGKDGLHLNEDGYKLWTSIIKPIVTESLGE